MHLYSIHMPVTGKDGLDCGIGIAGFPKMMAEIGFQDQDSIKKCTCSADGQKIIDFEISLPPTAKVKLTQIVYTQKNAESLKSKFLIEGNFGKAERKNAKGSISLGDHPVAQFIKTLNLSKNPVVVSYGKDAQALLFKPELLQ